MSGFAPVGIGEGMNRPRSRLRSAAFVLAATLSSFAAACASKPPPSSAATKPPAAAPEPVKPAEPPAATAAAAPEWQNAETIAAACEMSRARIASARESIKSALARTEAAVLVPENRLLAELGNRLGSMSVMSNVHPDKAARDAAEKCEQSLKQVQSEINLDRALHDAIAAVPPAALDAEAKRFQDKVLRDFRRSGVDKDEAVRARLKQIQDELVTQGQAFGRNIREDVRKIELDSKDLEGLPEDFVRGHKPNEAGKIVLTTDYPDFFPIQTYAKDESVRKRMLLAFYARATPANDTVLKKILALRFEYAKLLGYPSWAAYQAEDKMVKSSAALGKFIDDLAKLARPRRTRDLKEMLARKKKDNPKAKAIEAWDRFYYVDRLKSERFGVDSKVVRAYFEFNNVVKGLFEVYGTLFGLRFERTQDVPVWHESVIVYRLFSGNDPIGRFYLDLHPRDGKYKHAAMFDIVTGLADGPEPEAALVCNFPDPSKGAGPALMDHGDVRTFFHEFGHLIHHLLARSSKWANLSGISVELDFAEAPSQLLEEWVWDPEVLARFAKNIDTGAPIPPELVAKMRKADELGKGMGVMRQLSLAALSYELHAKDPTGIDLVKTAKAIHKRYNPFPWIEGSQEYASFGHLEGYSSMYYTYQWSLVIAKDIFTRFAKAGLLDPTTAGDYRTKILMQGGKRDAAELVRDFLGRDFNLAAYKAWLERD